MSPGNPVFYSNLSNLHGRMGHLPEAALAIANAVLSDTKNTAYQARFAQMIEHLMFHRATAETEVIRKATQICMANPAIDAALFSNAWHSLLFLDPVFTQLATLTQDGDFGRKAGEVNIGEFTESLASPFVLLGLRSLHATSAKYERVITFLRYLLVSRIADYDPDAFLPFLCAMAEHCYLNEYVYVCTKEELAMVDALEDTLDLSNSLHASSMAGLALVSCYKDPMSLDCANAVTQAEAASKNDAFAHFVRNAISIPAKIRDCLDTIPAFPPSDASGKNAVSSSVAKQYEENPYPRWRHLNMPVLSEQQKAMGRGKEILIAGCGTGEELLGIAAHYPEANVLGLDLSAPSLAYGKQKAIEFGIENVEFMRADILDIEELGRQFDLISCTGVLHHMEDPVEGWRKLLTCLKQDGFMRIALYSETARQTVALCRNWIEKEGIAATPDGIREFRQAVMAMDAENPLRDIMNWADFYSMSMCRDLVFHVQEHRVTLPWIQSVLNDLDLRCQSMRISNPLHRSEYLSMYSGDQAISNLDTLHEYEKHNPDAFRDMYSFWCCRNGSEVLARGPDWFFTAGPTQ